MVQKIHATSEEVEAIHGLLSRIRERYRSVEDPAFLRSAQLLAHELPSRLREALNDFKLDESSGALVIGGYPIDQDRIGRTPSHWSQRQDAGAGAGFEEGALLVLFGSLLGHTIGWATQQDGRVVHDILPIKGHEKEQLGSGCKEVLCWHTEDAFHPYRGDYICMMCLRNPDQVPTTVCSIDDISLTDEHKEILFQPRFSIRPDESHMVKNRSNGNGKPGEAEGAYARIDRMNTEPEKVSVLFGHPETPYMRADPYFMDRLEDAEAQEALDAFVQEVEEGLRDVALEPGDIFFIDNFRAVHGRRSFEARFDGNDRWLKRVNVVRDLRKSRDMRAAAGSLIIS